MKPKLESAYIAVENIDRALNFYEWFLERSSHKKNESLYIFNVDGFRFFLFDHNNENEEIKYYPATVISLLPGVSVNEIENSLKKTFHNPKTIIFIIQKISDIDDGSGLSYSKNKLEEILIFINEYSSEFQVLTYSQLFY